MKEGIYFFSLTLSLSFHLSTKVERHRYDFIHLLLTETSVSASFRHSRIVRAYCVPKTADLTSVARKPAADSRA